MESISSAIKLERMNFVWRSSLKLRKRSTDCALCEESLKGTKDFYSCNGCQKVCHVGCAHGAWFTNMHVGSGTDEYMLITVEEGSCGMDADGELPEYYCPECVPHNSSDI